MGNQQTKGYYGKRIDWEHADRPSPPGKPYLSPDTADPPDIVKIVWTRPRSDGGAPVVGYVVEHRRTGSPHWLRASPHLAPDTELVLTGLEPGWRYQFRVSAENAIGRSDPGELSEPLTVTLQRSAAAAPHFNRELQDIRALENDTVEFVVQVIATPTAKISWYKDGFEMFSSRRSKISTDNETSTLIIYNASLEDEGEIKCSATNRAGHVVCKAYLKIEALPRIRLPRQYEDGLIFERGETIRLKVSSAGMPPPDIEWHHNGQMVSSGGRHDVSNTEHGSTLRISDACRQDRGEYLVMASNRNGEDFASFLVTITDRPSAPGKPHVEMSLGRSVTLSWTQPDDDGGCKIGTYIVEYFRIGWDMWLKALTSRQLTVVLSELIEGSEYKFRVKAENPYGVSESSEESEVVFIADPKHGVFKPERKTLSLDAPRLDLEEAKKREAPREQTVETDSTKKRRVLEESAKKLLDAPQQSQPTSGHKMVRISEETPSESQGTIRRRALEENAKKLLDTPLSVLLSSMAPVEGKTMEKPPRRRKSDSRSTTVSPTPESGDSSPPPVPKRRKAKLMDSTPLTSPASSPIPPSHIQLRVLPSPSQSPRPMTPASSIRDAPSPSIPSDPVSPVSIRREFSPGPKSPTMLRDDSMIHGSSELVLVMLPDIEARKSAELSAQQKAEVELRLSEPAVAPPMSLSAPELGSEEPLEMPFLREAVSSSELLHERAMSRLYNDAAEEELSRSRGKSLERRHSGRSSTLERRHSLKESTIQSKIPTILAQPKPLVEKTIAYFPQDSPKVERKIPILKDSNKARPTKLTKSDRMNSEELEQLEFAKVREKLRLKTEEHMEPRVALTHKVLPNKKDGSTSSQMSWIDSEESYVGLDEEAVQEEELCEEDEELYEEEEIDEEEEEEGEEFIDEEEEEGSYDDEYTDDREEEGCYEEENGPESTTIKVKDSFIGDRSEREVETDDFLKFVNDVKLSPAAETKPPAVPLHGILKKSKESSLTEEDTYHPRSMITARSMVREIPQTNLTINPLQKPPMITLNDDTSQLKDSYTDKSDIKKTEQENSVQPQMTPLLTDGDTCLNKTDDGKSTQEGPEDTSIESEADLSNKKKKKEKQSRIPINKSKLFGFLKKDKGKHKEMQGVTIATLIKDTTDPVSSVGLPKPILKKRQISPKKKEKKKLPDSSDDGDLSEGRTKKQVRIAEPGSLEVPIVDDPNVSPLTRKRNERLQKRQRSLEEEEEANKVLICHYSDIVREFGAPKKAAPTIFLNLKDLEAHASGSNDSLNSDAEERGSGPDLEEVRSDLGSNRSGSAIELPDEVVEEVQLDEVIMEKKVNLDDLVAHNVDEANDKDMDEELKEMEEEKPPIEPPTILVSPSPTPSSCHSIGLSSAEKTRSLIDYLTDVGIFIFACWLYLFKSELYVIPVLVLLVYRQLQATVQKKYQSAKRAVAGRIPRRFLGKDGKETDEKSDNS